VKAPQWHLGECQTRWIQVLTRKARKFRRAFSFGLFAVFPLLAAVHIVLLVCGDEPKPEDELEDFDGFLLRL
jgi:hypothetical protein